MSRPQTLPFQDAALFKAVFARFWFPPQSLETHLPISPPPSGSSFPLSFFFVKSGLPHWGAHCASQIHLTCHLNQPLLSGPLPPISHHAPLSLPSLPSISSRCWGPVQAASSGWSLSQSPMTAAKSWLSLLCPNG